MIRPEEAHPDIADAPDASSLRSGGPSYEQSERAAFVTPILEAKGWSAFKWAVESDVDWHTVYGYLNGRTQPYRSTRLKLATALGMPVCNLPK